MKWTEGKVCVNGWDSDCGRWRIVPTLDGKAFLLIDFDNDTGASEVEYWHKRFPTLKEAQKYAERNSSE